MLEAQLRATLDSCVFYKLPKCFIPRHKHSWIMNHLFYEIFWRDQCGSYPLKAVRVNVYVTICLTHSYVSSVIFKLHEKKFTGLSLETTFKKFLESILRWKTTNLPQNSFWTKTKTLHRMICTRHSSQLTTFTSASSPLLSADKFKSVSF